MLIWWLLTLDVLVLLHIGGVSLLGTGFSYVHCVYLYYLFIVRFLIGLDCLFVTFLLHFFLSWMSSMPISSSAISADFPLIFQPVLYLLIIYPYIFSSSLHNFSSSHVHTILQGSHWSGRKIISLWHGKVSEF